MYMRVYDAYFGTYLDKIHIFFVHTLRPNKAHISSKVSTISRCFQQLSLCWDVHSGVHSPTVIQTFVLYKYNNTRLFMNCACGVLFSSQFVVC